MPVGPSILWLVQPRKSTPRSATVWAGPAMSPVARAHADQPVRHRLGAVEDGDRADGLGPRDDLRDRVDRAENVALVDERDDLGALVDEPFGIGGCEIEPAVFGEAEPAQRRPGPLARQLPRHQVGVVLHLGDDDLVAGSQALADRAGEQVQPLGDVLGEDDLARDRVAPRKAATFSRAPS